MITIKLEAANYLLQQQIYENKKKTMEIGKKIVEQLNSQEKETGKTEIEKVENNIVDNIIAKRSDKLHT